MRDPDAEKVDIPDVYPEGCKLLIEVDEAEGVTSGGIIVPPGTREAAQLRLTMGTVLRCGPDIDVRIADGKVFGKGSRIVFAKYGGFRLSDLRKTRDFRIINDEDVLAVIH